MSMEEALYELHARGEVRAVAICAHLLSKVEKVVLPGGLDAYSDNCTQQRTC